MKAKGKPRSRKPQPQQPSVTWGVVAIVVGLALMGLGGLWYLTRAGEPATASNVTTGSSTGPTANGPRIALDEDYYDFGTMKFEQWARREFRFRNVGNQPLALQGVPTVDAVEGC